MSVNKQLESSPLPAFWERDAFLNGDALNLFLHLPDRAIFGWSSMKTIVAGAILGPFTFSIRFLFCTSDTLCCRLASSACVGKHHHHHHHHHLSLDREGRWGTTDNFTTSFLLFTLFSTALWDLANSRHVHSIMLSFHRLIPPCASSSSTLHCAWPLAIKRKS